MSTAVTGAWRLALRRILAFSADYVVIAIYAGLVTVISLSLGASGESPSEIGDKLAGHVRSIAVLTIPVLLYFAIADAKGGTVGKRMLGLSVVSMDRGKAGLRACLYRSLVKFGPWELAHAGVWYVPGRPFIDPPAMINMAIWLIAIALAALMAGSMFTPSGRSIADHLARTVVIHKRSSD